MASQNMSKPPVGVLGAGTFGTAIANLLAENQPVILYARRPHVAEAILATRMNSGQIIHPQVTVSTDLAEVAEKCSLIFPIVPSEHFRKLIRNLAPHLKPDHILIHGTKGLDVQLEEGEELEKVEKLSRERVRTMSEVIQEETVVLRVGCMAGPNLAGEIADGQPAATVVASKFEEVIREGQNALRTSRFRVHGNHDLFGIEMAGVLKNIMAIGAGVLSGLGYGDNTRALLITRGLAEMVHIGKALGADPRAFLGLAGIGDLVATCSSTRSRNFTVGYRLAKGTSLKQIMEEADEVAEGIHTVATARAITDEYKIPAPITRAIYRTLFEDMDIERGMRLLMEYPFREDVEFI